MAYQLASNITDPNTGASLAGNYFKITDAKIDHTNQVLGVNLAVWASQAARSNGLAAILTHSTTLLNNDYSAAIGVAPVAGGPTNTVPTTVEDILLTNIYAALPTCSDPLIQEFLVGATVV